MKLIPNNLIDSFIRQYDVQPGYAIRAQGFDRVLDHWFLYLGYCEFPEADGELNQQHVFAAMMSPKMQFIGEKRMLGLLQKYFPVEVKRCYGDTNCDPCTVASNAIEKIRLDAESFHLIQNNCQDFVNLTTNGLKGSYQRTELYYITIVIILAVLVYIITKYITP